MLMQAHLLRKAIIIVFLVLFLGANILGQQPGTVNVVTTAVPFLQISPDARSGGMGDVGIAVKPDVNSNFLNAAKTVFNKESGGIGFTYTPWLKDVGVNDVYYLTAGGFYKLDDKQALHGAIRYFNLGDMQFTDYSGNITGSGSPKEYSFDLGYTIKLSNTLSLGITGRYIISALVNGGVSGNGTVYKTGHAAAADISLYQNNTNTKGEGLSWGVVLSNLGSKIGYTNDAANKDFIPANIGIGIAYTKVYDENNKITIALDANKLLVPMTPLSQDNGGAIDSAALASYRSASVLSSWFKSFGDGSNQLKDLRFSVGAEYSYDDMFMLRAGYYYESATMGNRKFFSVGAGFRYDIYGINLSYLVPSGNGITRNPLSNTLRFGITFNFGGK